MLAVMQDLCPRSLCYCVRQHRLPARLSAPHTGSSPCNRSVKPSLSYQRSLLSRAEWQRRGDVAVLGSGIMGLTTALQIKQSWRDVSVDIISEGTAQESTSHGAGGVCPVEVTPAVDVQHAWARDRHTCARSIVCSAISH